MLEFFYFDFEFKLDSFDILRFHPVVLLTISILIGARILRLTLAYNPFEKEPDALLPFLENSASTGSIPW